MSDAKWSRLENAAKIFPSTTSREDTKVFRFTCELTEMVQEAPLQAALEETLEFFPFYRYSLRRGLFWYFYEESREKPVVREEHLPPCSKLYHPDRHGLLFSVTYYRCRINLEVYHSLTDGTGALAFLRMLTIHYIKQVHGEGVLSHEALRNAVPVPERMSDSFARYYTGKKKYEKQKVKRAYRISGIRLPDHQIRVIEGTASASQILQKSHEYGTTASIFLCSVLLRAIHAQMPKRAEKYPVNLSVPVNLRNYFPSESARNFFSVITVGYDFGKNLDDFASVIAAVKEGFAKELTEEKVKGRLNDLCALEHNLLTRMVPLFLKDISLNIAHRVAAREITMAFSNIGRVDMPAEMAPYLRQFGVFVSTKRMQVCLCSYGDRLTMGFSAPFVDTSVQRHFFRQLTEMGIDVELTANVQEGGVAHADL